MSKVIENKEEHITLDIRSSAVTEILGQAPNWVVRWGITVVLFIIVLLLTAAALISYDDVIPARITITTLDPPVYIKARSTGKISQLLVGPDETVKRGQLLAIIENTAVLNDVDRAKNLLEEVESRVEDNDSMAVEFPMTLSLGELQPTYFALVTNYRNYRLYLKSDLNHRRASILTTQILSQEELRIRRQQQLDLFEEELLLAHKAYARNSLLLDSGVISNAEFESRSRAYLSDKQRMENLKVQMVNTEINIATLKGEKVSLLLSDQDEAYRNRQLVEEGIQNLRQALKDWAYRYVIKSPIDGQVTLFDVWNKYQNVELGATLFTIVPQNSAALIGRVVLPVKNSGKVAVGQEVIIKIDNYPYQEWGSLRGRIVNISAVPKQGLAEYAVQVEVNGLTTSFDKQLVFKQEMQGSAEIVTEALTVLQRVFYQLRQVLSRGQLRLNGTVLLKRLEHSA